MNAPPLNSFLLSAVRCFYISNTSSQNFNVQELCLRIFITKKIDEKFDVIVKRQLMFLIRLGCLQEIIVKVE